MTDEELENLTNKIFVNARGFGKTNHVKRIVHLEILKIQLEEKKITESEFEEAILLL